MPQETSGGDISWHMLTRCQLENIASPEYFGLQNGFFTIKNDFIHDVLSWLSNINLFALEIFVNESDLDTASGIVHIIFLPM